VPSRARFGNNLATNLAADLAAILILCKVARLQGCKVARLQGCKVIIGDCRESDGFSLILSPRRNVFSNLASPQPCRRGSKPKKTAMFRCLGAAWFGGEPCRPAAGEPCTRHAVPQRRAPMAPSVPAGGMVGQRRFRASTRAQRRPVASVALKERPRRGRGDRSRERSPSNRH
jgi:hypothetical protein